jgi:hypothetical protein
VGRIGIYVRSGAVAGAVDIGLGTTNAVVAVLEGREPTVIATAEGLWTMPRIAAFARNATVLTGEFVKRQPTTNVDQMPRGMKLAEALSGHEAPEGVIGAGAVTVGASAWQIAGQG